MVRIKLLKKFNMMFCLHRMAYSRCDPSVLADFLAFYNRVHEGLLEIGNEFYSIIKSFEAYTTSCILGLEK